MSIYIYNIYTYVDVHTYMFFQAAYIGRKGICLCCVLSTLNSPLNAHDA